MSGKIFDDGIHVTYGPYNDGDTLNFSEDLADATVSFDIFEHEIRDSRLVSSKYNTPSYYIEPKDDTTSWCVIDSDGKVGDHVDNLYFTFTVKQADTFQLSVDDEVNHPKHYTCRKAALECIMFTELMPSLAANAFKYVWRCDDKGNKTEDLEKARWYLDRACEIGCGEPSLGRRIQHLMVGMIDSSDFDEWHKLTLDRIVKGYYVDAYNDISDSIDKPRYCPANSLVF